MDFFGVLICIVLWFLWYSMSTTNRMSTPRKIIKKTPKQMDRMFSSRKSVNGKLVPTGDWRTNTSPDVVHLYDRTGGVLR